MKYIEIFIFFLEKTIPPLFKRYKQYSIQKEKERQKKKEATRWFISLDLIKANAESPHTIYFVLRDAFFIIYERISYYVFFYDNWERKWYQDDHDAKFLPLIYQKDMRRFREFVFLLPFTIVKAIFYLILDIYSGAFRKRWEVSFWVLGAKEIFYVLKYDWIFSKKVIALVYNFEKKKDHEK